jgi:RNA recognition motif-containing protein
MADDVQDEPVVEEDSEETNEAPAEEAPEEAPAEEAPAKSSKPASEDADEEGVQKNKLFVGNLPYRIESAALGEMFAEFGEVQEATIISDKFTGRSKGFGFVVMGDAEQAQKAIKGMDGKDVDGRPLKVNVARPKRENRDRDFTPRRDY